MSDQVAKSDLLPLEKAYGKLFNTMAEKKTAVMNDIDKMFKAGAHFGFSKSRRHPSAKPLIFGAKNKVEIFDLVKTDAQLAAAKTAIAALARDGKTILFVGGKREVSDQVREAAKRIGQLHLPRASAIRL